MLPVATSPNAIVFGSGYVTIPQMMRSGFALNIIESFHRVRTSKAAALGLSHPRMSILRRV